MEYGPDYRLQDWPSWLFAEEARTIAACRDPDLRARWADQLVQEVFPGPSPSRELADARQTLRWNVFEAQERKHIRTVQVQGVVEIEEPDAVSDLLMRWAVAVDRFPTGPRRYWRTRKHPTELPGAPLDGPSLQREWANLIARFDSDGYFDGVSSSACPDGPSEEERDLAIATRIADESGISRPWPVSVCAGSWDEDEFFTLIELMHDFVARPRSTWWHDYGKHDHYDDFNVDTGQKLYRHRVNELLRRSSYDLAMTHSGPHRGLLDKRPPDGLSELTQVSASRADDPALGVEDPVARATSMFLDRHATRFDKRTACVTLAGELESVRPAVKQEMLSKDEGMLFTLANSFALRHQRADQHADYADEYLDWVFWTYLATVELMRKLAEREAAPARRDKPRPRGRGGSGTIDA